MDLKTYLEVTGIKKQKFAQKAGIQGPTIWHALKGRDIRMSSLYAIIHASDYDITIKDMEKYRVNYFYNNMFKSNECKAPKQKAQRKTKVLPRKKSGTQKNASNKT